MEAGTDPATHPGLIIDRQNRDGIRKVEGFKLGSLTNNVTRTVCWNGTFVCLIITVLGFVVALEKENNKKLAANRIAYIVNELYELRSWDRTKRPVLLPIHACCEYEGEEQRQPRCGAKLELWQCRIKPSGHLQFGWCQVVNEDHGEATVSHHIEGRFVNHRTKPVLSHASILYTSPNILSWELMAVFILHIIDFSWELIKTSNTSVYWTGTTSKLFLQIFFRCTHLHNYSSSVKQVVLHTRLEGLWARVDGNVQKYYLNYDLTQSETLVIGRATDLISSATW